MALKRVEALVRPERLLPLRLHLQELGKPAFHVLVAPSRGRRQAVLARAREASRAPVWVEFLAQEENVPGLILAIRDACGGAEGLDEVLIKDA